ncbi:MAG: SprT-like domain-containing protein [Parachlamydiales bacterium]|nr:SprT-like domain-containing protein [Parachlamydiales bacterium]
MKHRLELLATFPIEIIWHENKTIYFSVKKENGIYSLRLHRLFHDAPSPVLEALLRYAVRRDKKAKAIIRQMAHLHFSRNVAEAKPLPPVGSVYDLKEVFDRLLPLVPIEGVSIGWSDRRGRGRLRSITFGTFDHHTRQIRINPILDDEQVPLYFLEYIVYHEMLHALCPSKMDGSGRCTVHSKEFREKERQFPRFVEAKVWEKGCFTFFKKRRQSGRS